MGKRGKKKFVTINGSRFEATPGGLLYCPAASSKKKHACPDCHFCQWCAESRCSTCRKERKTGPPGPLNPPPRKGNHRAH